MAGAISEQCAVVTRWSCRNCGAGIGTVSAGRLYLSGVEVLQGLVVCPKCQHTRRWVQREERNSRTAAVFVQSPHK